jgi:VWFA-related protein
MLRSLAAATVSSLLAICAIAQVTEIIEVRVVEVEVVVIDSHGKPVSGLTKSDFELREEGKPREITNFYAVERGQLLREAPGAATGSAPAVAEAPLPAPPTYFAFFVDNVYLDLRQRNRVLAAVRRFAEANLKEGVSASLITYSHSAKVRVPFTSDRAKILAAIDEIQHESVRLMEQTSERRSLMRRIDHTAASGGRRDANDTPDQLWRAVMMYANEQSRSVQDSLLAVGDALKRLRGVPGRKILVHVSSGLPLQPGVELMDYWRQAFQGDPGMVNMAALEVEQTQSFKRLIADAQASGVAIDTIDAGGLTGYDGASVENSGGSAQLNASLMRDNSRQTLQLIADETGGRSIINENDFDRALLAIASDTTTYYSLGFRGDGQTSLRHVDVRVKRPGLSVRSAKAHRDRTAEERIRDTVQSAFDFPIALNPLGVTLTSDPFALTVAPGKLVALPEGGAKTAHIRCYFQIRDANGGLSDLHVLDEDVVIEDESAPIALRKVSRIRTPSGRYTLSIAVRDLSSNETSYVQTELVSP